ncbi:MAG: cyclic nucleotide-binding domain-containing protein, partial [Sandaracinaceae bacterium]|nr:cyclic nucleotide-binding domain-containing protein [Sandaracinaceae bacterium]
MTPEQAAESGHTNLVTRAVGPSPSVLVDTLVFDFLAGDTLLLCTDGMHNYVNGSAELAVALAPEKLEDLTAQLIASANERGGSDNITTVAVRAVVSAPEAQAQSERASRVTEELAALGHIALFRELDMKEIVKVANRCQHLDLAPGEIVMSEGDASDALFVIVSGGAIVYRGNSELAVLRSGDHFGEMALLSRRPRTATVRTRKKTRLLRLDRDRFYEIMQQDAVLAAKFLWKLAQTLTLRLDDVYTLRDAERESSGGRPTQTYGLFPSPFDGR